MTMRRLLALTRHYALEVADFLVALVVAAIFGLVRIIPKRTAVNLGGTLARKLGMMLPRSERVGMRNLRLAFPEKDEAWRRRVLEECWDNLGRTAIEYCHLDHIWDFDPARMAGDHVESASVDLYIRLRDDGKPAIVVSAHLGNWELPMVAAAAHGLEAAALYRAPNNRWIARWVLARRKIAMGELIPTGPGAMHTLSERLERGVHVGLLTDQYFHKGIEGPLFGHLTPTNPAFARLARLHDCPVHAVRVIRLPGDRFRIELTEALDLPRDAAGRIDPAGAVLVMNRLFESWIREYPGQWLWLHRKWR